MVRFTLTDQHVKLLRAANVSWVDGGWGSPCIDPKRPYGNGGMIEDMVAILGLQGPVDPDWDVSPSEAMHDRMVALHRELETALQVVLAAGSFEPGEYEARDYRRDWRRVG